MKEELYGVVNGEWATGGKRYSIENYSVSGKTGTAEVVDPKTGTYYKSPYKVLHSFIGYAPSENPEVILYVGMKLPSKKLAESSANGASEIFKPIMQNILNVKKTSSDENLQNYMMDNFQGKNINEVISKLSTQTKNIVVIGSGDEVLGQFPSQGNILKKDDKVFLLSSNENMILPNFLGWSKADVLNYAELAGLNIETEGNGYVRQQSVPAKSVVKKRDNIKIKFS